MNIELPGGESCGNQTMRCDKELPQADSEPCEGSKARGVHAFHICNAIIVDIDVSSLHIEIEASECLSLAWISLPWLPLFSLMIA